MWNNRTDQELRNELARIEGTPAAAGPLFGEPGYWNYESAKLRLREELAERRTAAQPSPPPPAPREPTDEERAALAEVERLQCEAKRRQAEAALFTPAGAAEIYAKRKTMAANRDSG